MKYNPPPITEPSQIKESALQFMDYMHFVITQNNWFLWFPELRGYSDVEKVLSYMRTVIEQDDVVERYNRAASGDQSPLV